MIQRSSCCVLSSPAGIRMGVQGQRERETTGAQAVGRDREVRGKWCLFSFLQCTRGMRSSFPKPASTSRMQQSGQLHVLNQLASHGVHWQHIREPLKDLILQSLWNGSDAVELGKRLPTPWPQSSRHTSTNSEQSSLAPGCFTISKSKKSHTRVKAQAQNQRILSRSENTEGLFFKLRYHL